MAFRETSMLDDDFADPFYSSSRRAGETSMVPYGDTTLARRSGGGALDRYGGAGAADDFGGYESPFSRGGAGARETDYRASSRDDVYYSSRNNSNSSTGDRYGGYGGTGGSASSSMQVQLSQTSEEDSSSLRVRRQQVTVPPVETSRYATYQSQETSGGGYRETYKPGRRSLFSCRRRPEVASREAYSYSSSSSDRIAGGGGYGGGTYTSVTSDYKADSTTRDRYRTSSSGSFSRY